MELLTDIGECRLRLAGYRTLGLTIGLVPTMGALHEGHLSLVRRARQECGCVLVTVFVNPTQFGPGEDFDRYPRDLPADAELCAAAGADLLLAPPVAAVYPPGDATRVHVSGVSEGFEGALRPGHFEGVATVVTKLFHYAQPDRAYFGKKDYQQLQVIRRLVRDLGFPLEVVPCETVREADGLAMSSRNRYLSAAERKAAAALPAGLSAAAAAFAAGTRDTPALEAVCREAWAAEPRLRAEYAAVVDADTLAPVAEVSSSAVLLAAARVGATRLIDNVELVPEEPAA